MAKFGKYRIAEDQQHGMGAFPSVPSNITQNTSDTVDRIGDISEPNPNNGINIEPKVLTSKEIYDILKSTK